MKIEKFVEESLLFNLLKKAELIKQQISSTLKKDNLNFYQALILISLYTEKNRKTPLGPSDFIKILGLPKAVVSQALTKLEELKLIKRTVDSKDARKSSINIMPKGSKKAIAIMGKLDKLDKSLESSFNPREIQRILEFLAKLIK